MKIIRLDHPDFLRYAKQYGISFPVGGVTDDGIRFETSVTTTQGDVFDLIIQNPELYVEIVWIEVPEED